MPKPWALRKPMGRAFGEGKALLVPAECPDFYLVPATRDTQVLEISIAPREEKDSYLNP